MGILNTLFMWLGGGDYNSGKPSAIFLFFFILSLFGTDDYSLWYETRQGAQYSTSISLFQ